MLQRTPSAAAAGSTCMCMGVEEARAVDAGNRASADRDEVARDTERVRDTERRRTRSDAGPHVKQARRPDASPHPNVWALIFLYGLIDS